MFPVRISALTPPLTLTQDDTLVTPLVVAPPVLESLLDELIISRSRESVELSVPRSLISVEEKHLPLFEEGRAVVLIKAVLLSAPASEVISPTPEEILSPL